MKNKYQQLGKNTILMLISNFSSKFLVFLLLPLYTYCLTTTEYGVSDLIFTTVNLLYPLLTLLMTEAILRFALDKNSSLDNKNIFTISCFISGIGFIILVFLSPILANILEIPSYTFYFLIYYLATIIYLLFSQFAKGIGAVKEFAISGVLNTFLTIIFNIIFLVIFKLGIVGYILSYVLGMLISSLYLFIKLKYKDYLLSLKEMDKIKLKEMVKYSLPMIPNSISWWISNSSDKYILSYFCNFAITGIYSVSYKIPTLLTTFSSVFVGSWQLSAVDEFGSEENIKFHKEVYSNYSAIVIFGVAWLILFSKIISKILFASEYFDAWQPACILLFAFLFNTLSSFLGTIYTSAKKTMYLFLSTLIAALVNIVLNILFIPKYGMNGAAFATLVSYFIVWLFRLINTKKIINMNLNVKKDVISYFLITVEIIMMELAFSYVAIVFLAFLITVINYRELSNIVIKSVVKKIKKHKV